MGYIQVMILGHSWSLHNEPDKILKLHPRYSWCLHLPMNELKYVWMNEADSVFAKLDSLVEVPYFETSFLGRLNVNSMIPRSHGIRINDMKNVMCYVNYDMCYLYVVVYCMQYVEYDGACYSYGMTFLI